MRNRKSRLGAVAAVASTVCLTLAACGGGDSDATDGSDNGDSAAIAQEAWESEEPVTISVSDLPPTSKPEIREARLALIEDFEDKYPYITVEPEEVTWAADTFPTMLASDTVPTVMNLPFTEMQPMIQREQAADVTDYVALDEALGESNESLVELATGPDDRQYGVPMDAYTMGLYYNRSLFEEVGLDPDAPPQTWDEVRDAATKINDGTDAQGFIFMTSDNTGGWVFTPIVNGFGGETVSEDGTTATLDDPAVKEALQFYHDVRWEDNSAGSNFLVAFDDANQLFGAGQAGMYIAPGNQFNNIVTNLGMDVDEIGLAPLPQDSDGIGTLAGGTHGMINPKASPEEIAAAVKYLSFYKFQQYTDEEYAVTSAEAQAADGSLVGNPAVPLVSNELVDQWLTWIDDDINVPRDHFDAYIASVTPGDPDELPLIQEPRLAAQQIYAIEDTVIQTVLTDQGADIDALIADANDQAQAAIDEAASE